MQNPKQYTITGEQDSIPASIAPANSATITLTPGNRVAVVSDSQIGTAKVGDFIYIPAQNKFVEISRVDENKFGLATAWDGTLVSAGAFRITPKPRVVEVSMYYRSGNPIINGIERVEGQADTFNKSYSKREYYVAPIDVDTTSDQVVDVSVMTPQ